MMVTNAVILPRFKPADIFELSRSVRETFTYESLKVLHKQESVVTLRYEPPCKFKLAQYVVFDYPVKTFGDLYRII